jgi:hypothetical protein
MKSEVTRKGLGFTSSTLSLWAMETRLLVTCVMAMSHDYTPHA